MTSNPKSEIRSPKEARNPKSEKGVWLGELCLSDSADMASRRQHRKLVSRIAPPFLFLPEHGRNPGHSPSEGVIGPRASVWSATTCHRRRTSGTSPMLECEQQRRPAGALPTLLAGGRRRK